MSKCCQYIRFGPSSIIQAYPPSHWKPSILWIHGINDRLVLSASKKLYFTDKSISNALGLAQRNNTVARRDNTVSTVVTIVLDMYVGGDYHAWCAHIIYVFRQSTHYLWLGRTSLLLWFSTPTSKKNKNITNMPNSNAPAVSTLGKRLDFFRYRTGPWCVTRDGAWRVAILKLKVQ